jgi:glutaredoxin
MKTKAIFYHDAGCQVCQAARRQIIHALDPERYDVEEVDLSTAKQRIPEAAEAGVKTVPALVMNDHVFHINRGADLTALI